MRTLLVLAALIVPSTGLAETHRLRPTTGHATFAVRPPVLTVKPGDIVESESLWGEWYEKAGGKWPGEVGPVDGDGAEPGDTWPCILRWIASSPMAAAARRPSSTSPGSRVTLPGPLWALT